MDPADIPACQRCNKALVCRILAGFAQLIGDFDIPPIDPDHLAAICQLYWDKDTPVVVKFELDEPEETVVLDDEPVDEDTHPGTGLSEEAMKALGYTAEEKERILEHIGR